MRWTRTQLVLIPLLLLGCAGGPALVATKSGPEFADVPTVPAELLAANPYLQGRLPITLEAQRRFAQAKLLVEKEDWQSALHELQLLVDSYPALSGPCLDLALVYRQLGDDEQAGLWFQRSIDKNASNIGAYNEYGFFLREQGQFVEAKSIYLLALGQWEASADTHRNLGILYDLYLGQPQKALQHYYRYQLLTDDTDQEVAGWIADLGRRHQSGAKGVRS